MTETDQVGVTIDLALHLHPNADTVAVITGNSEFDKYWLAVVHAEVFRHRDKVREIDLVGLPTSQLLDSVAALSPQTVVLFQEYASGSIQSAMVVRDILAWVGQRLPTYCVFPDVCVSGGGIGGVGRDPKEQYLLAAQLARRVLAGERPESIRVMNGVAYQVSVDWRQVHHWKIPESSLPPNTLVLYRPEPLWQRYRWQLELAIVFLLGLILLGVYLLVERARRRRAEAIVTRQLSFETLISQISSELVNTPAKHIGEEIKKSLSSLREFLGVGRISIFKIDDQKTSLHLRHSARVEAVGTPAEVLSRAEFPWLFERLAETEPIVISELDGLPSEAKAELEYFRATRLRAIVISPLRVENSLVGMLTFLMIQHAKSWSEDLLPQVTALSQVCANAFARELAQEALAESESRFRFMGDAAPAFIWISDKAGRFTYISRKTVDFTGAPAELLNGNGWFSCLHPDDLPGTLEARAEALQLRERFMREYRVRRHDGVYRWMLDIGNPRYDSEGVFVGFMGSAVDVTDQHVTQEELERVSGRLIAAQEKERSFIARELHDDICQRLFILSLRIENVAKGWNRGQLSVGEQLEQIWQQCSDLTGDVQALSHGLHPSVLDHLGLVAAARSFCTEFSEESGTMVQFKDEDIPHSLPREVSLSLFRVIQEALHNAAKHSGETLFEVHLQGKPGKIELEVSDRGVGFDVTSMKGSEGLGLVSMAERIHLLNGTINIDSQPNRGTRIRACVPVATDSKAMNAACELILGTGGRDGTSTNSPGG